MIYVLLSTFPKTVYWTNKPRQKFRLHSACKQIVDIPVILLKPLACHSTINPFVNTLNGVVIQYFSLFRKRQIHNSNNNNNLPAFPWIHCSCSSPASNTSSTAYTSVLTTLWMPILKNTFFKSCFFDKKISLWSNNSIAFVFFRLRSPGNKSRGFFFFSFIYCFLWYRYET